jgi:deoxycytidylate deaminase
VNQRIYQRAVEIVTALKAKTKNGKSHHGALIYKKGKILSIGVNNYLKRHNSNRFGQYADHKGYTTEYKACRHAEISAIIRHGEEDLSDCEMLVVRIDNKDNPSLSKCCINCARVLKGLNIKKVFYSNEQGEFQRDERF